LQACPALPATVASLLHVILVAALAPVRQSLSYGSRPPQILRPRTAGLEYSTEISVIPTTWLTFPRGLGRGSSSCASAGLAASIGSASAIQYTVRLVILLLRVSLRRGSAARSAALRSPASKPRACARRSWPGVYSARGPEANREAERGRAGHHLIGDVDADGWCRHLGQIDAQAAARPPVGHAGPAILLVAPALDQAQHGGSAPAAL